MTQQNIAYNCNIINMSTSTHTFLLVVPRTTLPKPNLPRPSLLRPSLPTPVHRYGADSNTDDRPEHGFLAGEANQCPAVAHDSNHSATTVASQLRQTRLDLQPADPRPVTYWQIADDQLGTASIDNLPSPHQTRHDRRFALKNCQASCQFNVPHKLKITKMF